jgi:hypothetical protein
MDIAVGFRQQCIPSRHISPLPFFQTSGAANFKRNPRAKPTRSIPRHGAARRAGGVRQNRDLHHSQSKMSKPKRTLQEIIHGSAASGRECPECERMGLIVTNTYYTADNTKRRLRQCRFCGYAVTENVSVVVVENVETGEI